MYKIEVQKMQMNEGDRQKEKEIVHKQKIESEIERMKYFMQSTKNDAIKVKYIINNNINTRILHIHIHISSVRSTDTHNLVVELSARIRYCWENSLYSITHTAHIKAV